MRGMMVLMCVGVIACGGAKGGLLGPPASNVITPQQWHEMDRSLCQWDAKNGEPYRACMRRFEKQQRELGIDAR